VNVHGFSVDDQRQAIEYLAAHPEAAAAGSRTAMTPLARRPGPFRTTAVKGVLRLGDYGVVRDCFGELDQEARDAVLACLSEAGARQGCLEAEALELLWEARDAADGFLLAARYGAWSDESQTRLREHVRSKEPQAAREQLTRRIAEHYAELVKDKDPQTCLAVMRTAWTPAGVGKPLEPAPAPAGRAEAAALSSPGPDDVGFRAVPLPIEAKTLALSEYGRLLYIANDEVNRVMALDAVAEEVLATICTPRPSRLLVRGRRLYVANEGQGTISVYDQAKEWKLEKTIPVNSPYIRAAAAPGGKHFQGKLLLTCLTDDRKAVNIVEVNTATDEVLSLVKERDRTIAGVSYDGRRVLLQRGHDVVETPYAEFLKSASIPHRDTRDVGRHLYQNHRGWFWLGAQTPAFGSPPGAVTIPEAQLSVGDRTDKAFYVFSQTKVTGYALDIALEKRWERHVRGIPGGLDNGTLNRARNEGGTFAATTLDGATHLYIACGKGSGIRKLYHGVVEPGGPAPAADLPAGESAAGLLPPTVTRGGRSNATFWAGRLPGSSTFWWARPGPR